jgi:tRNA G18 (ribose-2'-O)-methylase SpoU
MAWQVRAMRGYFGIGIEGVSKTGNMGNLFRSAHAFGAGFVFTIAPDPKVKIGTDTSSAYKNVPFFNFADLDDFRLPHACQLVGIELTDDAVDLPAFHHPHSAAYVLGPELGSLSPGLLACCDHVVKIPTSFCVNVAIAGAIVMYDRIRMHGKFSRPVTPHGGAEEMSRHVRGGRFVRTPKADRGT